MTALLPSEIPMNRLTISGLFAPTAAAVFFQLPSAFRSAFSIPPGGFDRKYPCRMGYHGLAESLHISQPRCSSGLMELEQKLGKPLFLRGKRKITLSADAP